MKEIVVYATETSKYKVIIFENSVSFVEEYSSITNEKSRTQTNHCNVPIKEIHKIKYSHTEDTAESQTNILPFILAALSIIVAIVLFTLKIWIGGGIFTFVFIILLIWGFLAITPEETSDSQSLIIEGEDKTLYQKRVNLDNDKLLDIINSIREKQ